MNAASQHTPIAKYDEGYWCLRLASTPEIWHEHFVIPLFKWHEIEGHPICTTSKAFLHKPVYKEHEISTQSGKMSLEFLCVQVAFLFFWLAGMIWYVHVYAISIKFIHFLISYDVCGRSTVLLMPCWIQLLCLWKSHQLQAVAATGWMHTASPTQHGVWLHQIIGRDLWTPPTTLLVYNYFSVLL